MKVRELIEMLAKKNWDAEVVLDTRPERTNTGYHNFYDIEGIDAIGSITECTTQCEEVITINTRKI